ncbi:hypothetical protein PENTCL1PPCAC_27618, partial [Pristionchus entomophagus]
SAECRGSISFNSGTMNLLTIILLSACATGAMAEWKCGARPQDSAVARASIGFLCPNRKMKINRCCRDHDACYRKKTGRDPCDDEFERCALKSAKSTLCEPLMKGFVSLVRAFGSFSYEGQW